MPIGELSKALLWLPGKTSQTQADGWLPAWRHMLDTAQTMRLLMMKWVPEAVKSRLGAGLPEGEAERVAEFAAMVHDIGKLTPVFSSKLLPMLPEVRNELCAAGLSVPAYTRFSDPQKTPHALAGAAFLHLQHCPAAIVAAVGAHHGKPISKDDAWLFRESYPYPLHYFGLSGQSSPEGALWHQVRREWLAKALKHCGYASVEEVPMLGKAAQMLLTGLLIVADWIASNPEYFPYIMPWEKPVLTWDEQRAQTALERWNPPTRWLPDAFSMDGAMFLERFAFPPNAVQRAAISAASTAVNPGIFILEAQMGVGKTEAALGAVEVLSARRGKGGMFFGLPTQATANGIFPRLKKWAEGQSQECVNAIQLAHGMANLNEAYTALFEGDAAVDDEEEPTGLMVHRWFNGRKKALLADFVIGTVDQLLMASLKQKHVMLRHLGLAGKTVVIDECHAYNTYMSVYLENALMWLGAYQTPVILLSATLPAARRRALVEAYLGRRLSPADGNWQTSREYPLLTWTDGDSVHSTKIQDGAEKRAIHVDRLFSPDEREDGALAAAYLEKSLAQGGCAAVIVNTVKRAQHMAESLRQRMPEAQILLVHAQYLMEDRAAWEKKLMARTGKASAPEDRDGLIVVGTQVLEQSLDIDVDVMITDLCPMDLLLQRVGRLHRHRRERPAPVREARCAVLLPADGKLEGGAEAVYGQWLLLRTLRFLPDAITLPNSIPALVQAAYAEPEDLPPDGAEAMAYHAHCERMKDKRERARAFCLQAPKEDPKRPQRNTLNGLLDQGAQDDERHGEAAVRDGEPSVEVLVMQRHSDGRIGFVPWHEDGRIVSRDYAPSREEAMRIARQRIRLPRAVAGGFEKAIGQTIRALEDITRRNVPEWQQDSLLKGELFLLLDENCQAQLRGYRLAYHPHEGLTYWKEDCDG